MQTKYNQLDNRAVNEDSVMHKHFRIFYCVCLEVMKKNENIKMSCM